MMRKITLMVGLIGLLGLLSASETTRAQVPTLTRVTDRDQWGIKGAAAKMTVEFTVFRGDGDKWIESPRQFSYEVEFDRAGNLVKQNPTPQFGDPISPSAKCQSRFVRDEKGRAKEEYETCGEAEKLKRKFTYEDDAHGNWIKKVTFVVIAGTNEIRKQSVDYRTFVYFD